MQQSSPAHLKGYQGGVAHMPSHIEQSLTQHMQKTMPAHMQQYIQPYLQQQVVNQRGVAPAGPAPIAAPHPGTHAPTSQLPRQNFVPQEGQRVEPNQPVAAAIPAAPNIPAQPAVVTPEQQFDFIMNPDQPVKKSGLLGGGSSLPTRLALGSGGLLVLLIILIVLKNLLGGSANLTPFVAVAQQQQELIHLATAAQQQQDLSVTNQNSAITTQLTIASSQSNLLAYLKQNKTKINAKQLGLKISATTDTQLTTAESAGTYNQTYQTVMQNELSIYMSGLQQAYKTAGKNGRALLTDEFNQAKLLKNQLGPATS